MTAKMEILKGPLPVELEIFLVIGVYWQQEVGIFQVQLSQPIPSYQIFYHAEALHLQVLLHDEPVQCL